MNAEPASALSERVPPGRRYPHLGDLDHPAADPGLLMSEGHEPGLISEVTVLSDRGQQGLRRAVSTGCFEDVERAALIRAKARASCSPYAAGQPVADLDPIGLHAGAATCCPVQCWGSARIYVPGPYVSIARPPPHAFAYIFRMACLSMWHSERNHHSLPKPRDRRPRHNSATKIFGVVTNWQVVAHFIHDATCLLRANGEPMGGKQNYQCGDENRVDSGQ